MRIAVCSDKLNEIHFSIRGPPGTMFDGGVYHGSIRLPQDFPYNAPSVQLLSPSGRFTLKKDICINGYTAWHQDTWSPAITIAAIVRAVRSLFNDIEEHGIGYDFNPDPAEVEHCKTESTAFVCPQCKMAHASCFTS